MSAKRRERLAKLVSVLHQLKAFHETRHAGHMAEAAAAETEARAIAGRLDEAEPMAALFPELYHRRMDSALRRGRESAENADREARNVLAADARADAAARAYRETAALDERDRADKDRQEFITRTLTKDAQ